MRVQPGQGMASARGWSKHRRAIHLATTLPPLSSHPLHPFLRYHRRRPRRWEAASIPPAPVPSGIDPSRSRSGTGSEEETRRIVDYYFSSRGCGLGFHRSTKFIHTETKARSILFSDPIGNEGPLVMHLSRPHEGETRRNDVEIARQVKCMAVKSSNGPAELALASPSAGRVLYDGLYVRLDNPLI